MIDFVFAVLCGYFSGLVGLTASPGSAIVISGLLFMALILRGLLFFKGHALLSSQLLDAVAMTVIIGAMVGGIVCIADNTPSFESRAFNCCDSLSATDYVYIGSDCCGIYYSLCHAIAV